MQLSKFDYYLPQGLIAQKPTRPRDHSRLLVIDRKSKSISHHYFYELPNLLNSNYVLVANDTRVFPARLIGQKETGGKVEVLLSKQLGAFTWEALAKPGLASGKYIYFTYPKNDVHSALNGGMSVFSRRKQTSIPKPTRWRLGELLLENNQNGSKDINNSGNTTVINSAKGVKDSFLAGLSAVVTKPSNSEGVVNLKFNAPAFAVKIYCQKLGETPLPPYIKPPTTHNLQLTTQRWYQTVYASHSGSVAAPTAGFHFTKKLLKSIKNKNIEQQFVTLHVGLGTFLPVRKKTIERHLMHAEWFNLSQFCAQRLNRLKLAGKKITAVGTTTTRVLEAAVNRCHCEEYNDEAISRLRRFARNDKIKLIPQTGFTNLYIYPPYRFQFVDALITNFHLPCSTLLMLVAAFTSWPNPPAGGQKFISFKDSLIGKAYQEAIKKKYRFYSFGDAMLIL